MSTITTLNSSDTGPVSRGVINTNLANLNADKMETSVLDTDVTLAANSDAKVATQKAVKTYVDTEVAGLSKVRVRAYKSGSTQSIGSPLEKVLFESESYDIGSDYDTSTSIFTAPRTGYYQITANGDGTSGASSVRAVTIAIYKNGAIYSSATTPMTPTSGVASGAAISDTLYLTASDTIEIYAVCNVDSINFATGERYTFINIIEL